MPARLVTRFVHAGKRLWRRPLGDVERARAIGPADRSRWQHARVRLADWPGASPWVFGILSGVVAAIGGVLGSVVTVSEGIALKLVGATAGFLVGLLALWVLAAAIFVVRARSRQFDIARAERDAARDRAARARSERPQLTFGRAQIPGHSQPIYLPDEEGRPFRWPRNGRVIRVPVINAHGAGLARQVHARLNFMPDDRDGSFSPREIAQGEWLDEQGVEFDLPGNGRPRLLDVVLVLDGDYPQAHEWTQHSRAARLAGYAISAVPFDVAIEILATDSEGTPVQLNDTLRVDVSQGMIRADWLSAGPDEPTNWVAR